MYGQLLLLALTSLTGIKAQGTNASILDIDGFEGLPLSGEVVGTGADGTTFVISASGTDAGDVPFTMTVVQDATHISEVLSLATGFGANIDCAYDSQGVNLCTAIFEGGGSGSGSNSPPQTTVFSGSIPLLAVPVTTATANGDASTLATQTLVSVTSAGSDSPSASASADSSSSGSARTITSIGLATIFSTIFATTINI